MRAIVADLRIAWHESRARDPMVLRRITRACSGSTVPLGLKQKRSTEVEMFRAINMHPYPYLDQDLAAIFLRVARPIAMEIRGQINNAFGCKMPRMLFGQIYPY